jgi:hypothetical protein
LLHSVVAAIVAADAGDALVSVTPTRSAAAKRLVEKRERLRRIATPGTVERRGQWVQRRGLVRSS